ncbi:MAG: hypothetical protein HC860_25195 [Alkalinema sp. RU_4_3]|nr:hypothetical protein [Alkalinema sp. RU_4_3]
MADDGQEQNIGDVTAGGDAEVTLAGRDAIVNSTIIKESYYSLFLVLHSFE